MKTLKQFFQKKEKETNIYIDNIAIEAVKEWLQQFIRVHDCNTTSFCCATELLKALEK